MLIEVTILKVECKLRADKWISRRWEIKQVTPQTTYYSLDIIICCNFVDQKVRDSLISFLVSLTRGGFYV